MLSFRHEVYSSRQVDVIGNPSKEWGAALCVPSDCPFATRASYQSTYSGKKVFETARNRSVDLLSSSTSSLFTLTRITASSSGR
jgi:hypothetical protein